MAEGEKRARALEIILLLGLVSLCGDVMYEGAWAVSGPFLLLLGGSATVVGLVSGLGELLGYGLRLASGYLADQTRRYWLFLAAGYGMLIAVPLLAFAGSWEIAAMLYLVERMGKGIRSPSKDAILSHASSRVGRGWGFALHEALDQVGAIVGPLVFTAVFVAGFSGLEGYRAGFLVLGVPMLFLAASLLAARMRAPDPVQMELGSGGKDAVPSNGIPPVFVPYALFTALTMAGFVAFPLVAYHLRAASLLPEAVIPLLYALAMGMDAVGALLIGRAYDRSGLAVLVVIPVLNLPVAFLAFQATEFPAAALPAAALAASIWGVSLGAQETILRAAVADMVPVSRRGTAYGIFNTVYGGAWFLGSVAFGLLYDRDMIPLLIIISAALQILSVPAVLRVIPRGPDRAAD